MTHPHFVAFVFNGKLSVSTFHPMYLFVLVLVVCVASHCSLMIITHITSPSHPRGTNASGAVPSIVVDGIMPSILYGDSVGVVTSWQTCQVRKYPLSPLGLDEF